MRSGNIFSAIPGDLPQELCETLLQTSGVRLERLVSRGHASAEGFWYEQEEAEWVLLLKGRAAVRIEGEEQAVVMKPGDYLLLPAHCRHRVEWTAAAEETVWLALHLK